MKDTRDNIKQLTKTAMMAALVFLGTFVFKIPTPNGYTHLGDCLIFVAVLALGWKRGAIAGGLGAALADLAGGYAVWIIPTFFIKSIMAIIMGLITEKVLKKYGYGWIPGAIAGGIFQILAYTIVKFPLYGKAIAITEFIPLTIQTVTGVVLSIVIVAVLDKSRVLNKLKEA